MEAFTIDDSEQGPLLGGNTPNPRPAAPLISRRSILALIAFPFNLLSNILRFLFGVLHIPFPRTFSTLNFFTPRTPSTNKHLTGDPKSVVDRWVRSLEEETGAVCISAVGRNESTGVAGPSTDATLRNRGDAYGNGRVLPDFYLGGYEEAMRLCQKELRLGCVILVSDEHEDVGEFKRSAHYIHVCLPVLNPSRRTTLTDPDFVKFLQANNFVVWGGDIRDKDAWSSTSDLTICCDPRLTSFQLLRNSKQQHTRSSPSLACNPGAHHPPPHLRPVPQS